ncbi:MATE family efflux transporter [Ferrovibrio terrae]|uniref:MATE family efflux transporter n=1 Tax=Ferrovibrio terrae TaxID=2594003 RepID=UPI0031381909
MILKEARATLTLSLPIVGTQLAQMAIHTTDVWLLSHYSAEALGAAALGVAIFSFLWMAGLGLATATPALAAQARGRDPDDIEGVRQAVHDGLISTGIYGLVCTLLLIFSEPFLVLIGQPPELIALAVPFMQAVSGMFITALWFMVLRGFLATLERPRAALVLTLLAVLLNAAVNTVLIFGFWIVPSLGVVGAGIGSSLVNLLILLVFGWYIARDPQFAAYHLSRGWWRTTPERMSAFLRVGAPIALALGAEIGLFSAAALLMGRLGAAEVAAHQVALQWAALAFMVPMGLSQAATVRVGLAAGARDYAGAARAGWIAIAMGMSFMLCTALIFHFAGGLLVRVFVSDAASTVFTLAVTYLGIAALFQLVDGAQGVANGALRGLKDTAVPMVITLVGYWLIGFPVAIWFGFYTPLRGIGVWAGLVVGLAVVAALLLWRFYAMTHRLQRLDRVPAR